MEGSKPFDIHIKRGGVQGKASIADFLPAKLAEIPFISAELFFTTRAFIVKKMRNKSGKGNSQGNKKQGFI